MKDITPKTGSRAWSRNEKIINESPTLKKARDTAQGIKKSDGHYKQTHGGKGSAPRTNYLSEEYGDNYDRIFKKGKYAEDKDE